MAAILATSGPTLSVTQESGEVFEGVRMTDQGEKRPLCPNVTLELQKTQKNKGGKPVGIEAVREFIMTLWMKYQVLKSRDEKSQILNSICVTLGIHRKAANRLMTQKKIPSLRRCQKFKAQVYILNKEEGGRHKPFFKGYRPQFYFRTTDVTGVVELPAAVEMMMPGDNVEISVDLITPVAMEPGLRFAIREGGRTVGAGTVSTCEV